MDEIKEMELEARAEAAKLEDPLEVLLGGTLPDMRHDTKHQTVEIPRLSEAAGHPVAFEIRGLTHREVQDINAMPAEERAAQKVVMACVKPDWADRRLCGPGTGHATAEEAVMAALSPGELNELALRINLLTGYGQMVTREIKEAVKNG